MLFISWVDNWLPSTSVHSLINRVKQGYFGRGNRYQIGAENAPHRRYTLVIGSYLALFRRSLESLHMHLQNILFTHLQRLC